MTARRRAPLHLEPLEPQSSLEEVMAFFAIMGVVTLAAAAVQLLAIGFVDYPAAMRWGMAAALLLFGTDHLVKPARYLPMMPNVVPYPREIVLFTGLCEI